MSILRACAIRSRAVVSGPAWFGAGRVASKLKTHEYSASSCSSPGNGVGIALPHRRSASLIWTAIGFIRSNSRHVAKAARTARRATESRLPAAMGWPPQIGDSLPRAARCWHEQTKLLGWILSPAGHGREWERVFHVTAADHELVWAALAASAIGAEIVEVRDREPNGIACGVEAEVAIGERSARVTMSWHYADSAAAPRLATAYPSP